MSYYIHCTKSKISQQVLHYPSANQSTQLFHRVYIDWLDLEDSWDSYQTKRAVIRQVMVAICKATGIAVTCFIKYANKSENLPLI